MIAFTKMHGLGNDYIYFNCFQEETNAAVEKIIKATPALSDRHFGVGGDGTVLIMPSSVADARMRMFNIDGSEGKMCGNAIRCVGKFLYEHGIVRKQKITVETLSGIKMLDLDVDNGKVKKVTVDMGRPEFDCAKIPCAYGEDTLIEKVVVVGGEKYEITAVSMGNPHAVIFGGDPEFIDIKSKAEPLQNSAYFPEGVNVEFIEVLSDCEINMRVYERGSGETLACGTGACASVAAGVATGRLKKGAWIKVNLRGGVLEIKYDGDTVLMKGSATTAFVGTVNLED